MSVIEFYKQNLDDEKDREEKEGELEKERETQISILLAS